MKFVHLATADFDESELADMHGFHKTSVERMKRGEIPLSLTFNTLITLVAAPASFSVSNAQSISLFNVFAFLGVVGVVAVRALASPLRADCSINLQALTDENWSAFSHDITFILLLFIVAHYTSTSRTKHSSEVEEMLRSSREADNVLNHILKNSMASVGTLLEIEMKESDYMRGRLHEAAAELHRAMSWCASRQVLMSLSAGTYQTCLSPVNIADFVEDLAIDPKKLLFACNDVQKFENATVAFDEKMARIALENAKTNALAHGDGGMLELKVTFIPEQPSEKLFNCLSVLFVHLIERILETCLQVLTVV
jgi:signal transduction histidine kinase